MKQFSLLLILASCILGIVARVMNIVDIYFFNLDVFSIFSDTYTKFGELTLFAGFLFLGQSLGVLMLANLLTHFSSSFVIGCASVVALGLGLFLAHAIENRQVRRAHSQ